MAGANKNELFPIKIFLKNVTIIIIKISNISISDFTSSQRRFWRYWNTLSSIFSVLSWPPVGWCQETAAVVFEVTFMLNQLVVYGEPPLQPWSLICMRFVKLLNFWICENESFVISHRCSALWWGHSSVLAKCFNGVRVGYEDMKVSDSVTFLLCSSSIKVDWMRLQSQLMQVYKRHICIMTESSTSD